MLHDTREIKTMEYHCSPTLQLNWTYWVWCVSVEKLGDWFKFNIVENASADLVLSREQMSSMAIQNRLLWNLERTIHNKVRAWNSLLNQLLVNKILKCSPSTRSTKYRINEVGRHIKKMTNCKIGITISNHDPKGSYKRTSLRWSHQLCLGKRQQKSTYSACASHMVTNL